jgi:hypothetical protein
MKTVDLERDEWRSERNGGAPQAQPEPLALPRPLFTTAGSVAIALAVLALFLAEVYRAL